MTPRFERLEEVDDPCSECDAEPANAYDDYETGDEVTLCTECAEDYPHCPCGARGEIPISNSGGLVVCRRCADEEEGEEA